MPKWMKHHFKDAETARTAICNIATAGGLVGFVCMMIAVYMAHGR